MNVEKVTYYLFLVLATLAFIMSIFTDGLMLYFKPPVIIALIVYYIIKATDRNYLVVFTLLLYMVCEILYFYDYQGNFMILNLLLSFFYFLNIVILWKSLNLVKIRFHKVFTLILIVSMVLISYILFNVVQLILPRVNKHIVVLTILVVFLILFIGVCYYIYLNSKTVISYSLMVTASCFLIVNIIAAVDKLYVSLEIFKIIANLLQIVGQFFLVKFFIEQDKLSVHTDTVEDYF